MRIKAGVLPAAASVMGLEFVYTAPKRRIGDASAPTGIAVRPDRAGSIEEAGGLFAGPFVVRMP